MRWYVKKGSGGQGLIVDEADGRSVAVAYEAKDAALIGAAPELFDILRGIVGWEAHENVTLDPRQVLDIQRTLAEIEELSQ